MNRFAAAGCRTRLRSRALTFVLPAFVAFGVAVSLSAKTSGKFALGGTAEAASSDDRSVAETILREVGGSPSSSALVAEPVGKARNALDRAARMRMAGDEAHARLADALARDWAETARDLLATVEAEAKAAAARRNALDAGASAERERAMLEDAVARVGRLRAQLENAEREKASPEPANVTSTTAAKDGGAR